MLEKVEEKEMISMNKLRPVVASVMIAMLSVWANAQGARGERSLSCDSDGNSDRASHCEIKEQTIGAVGGMIVVDGKKNGGVSVKGWERAEILVRSKIQSWAATEAEAKSIASGVRVETGGANIYAVGPEPGDRAGWSVSYEVFVPRNSNLSLKTHNGGIGVSDVRGSIDFSAVNGGVSLRRLAGVVKGSTTNGGVSIELSGNAWDGEGVDVRTSNGGVSLSVPENYSARLEAGTVNGGIKVNIPITIQGQIKRELSVDLGGGGALIRARTTNGGVSVNRKG
jgi:hypothetical protein